MDELNKIKKPVAYWVIGVLFLAAIIALAFKVNFFESLWMLIVSVLLLFVPGFLFLSAFFDGKENLCLTEKTCMSMVFSFALVSIVFFYIHFTGLLLGRITSVVGLLLLIALLGYFAYKKKENKKTKIEKMHQEHWLIKFLLVAFVLLALGLAAYPRIIYEYPRHADEWVHFQFANHLSDNSPLFFGQAYASLEAGFHCIMAPANSLGIDYILMFRIFPLIITLMLCLSAFILTRKMFKSSVAGLFSVIFVSLIPTTTMLLGPGFFVPVALGMVFLLAALFLIEIESLIWFVLLASAFLIHPISAIAMLVVINIQFVLRRKGFIKNLGLELLGFLIALPMYLPVFLKMGLESLDKLSMLKISSGLPIMSYIGCLGFGLATFGALVAIFKRKFGLVLAYAFFVGLVFVEGRVLGYDFGIPSTRVIMYTFALFAVFFGAGAGFLINSWKSKKIRAVVFIILVVAILLIGLPLRLKFNDSFSTIAFGNDKESFKWIQKNTPKDAVFLCDPLKSHALTPMAERQVYARYFPTTNLSYSMRNAQVYRFIRKDCTNETLLREINLSWIYGECRNPNLTRVAPDVYYWNKTA